jgi:surface carbohydrate biosynthesis protein
MKVLNLEWTSYPSRDREAATLICNYLRFKGNIVVEGSIHSAFYLILKHKPDVVYISNIIGSFINHEVALFLKKSNIPLYTSHSEGDFKVKYLKEFVWGDTRPNLEIESILFFWSYRNAKLTCKNFPIKKNIAFISGSPGHDRYIIEKNDITNLNKTKFKISIICFDFSFINEGISNVELSKEAKFFFTEQLELFDNILSKLINENPQIEFLIRPHPSNYSNLYFAGVKNASNLKNASVVDINKSIMSILLETDLSISYSSNAAVEAWLLDKPSCCLNPITSKWPNEVQNTPFYMGMKTCNNYLSLSDTVKEVLKTNKIKLNKDQISNREKIINDIVGFTDGLNHVRIGNKIIEHFSKINQGKRKLVFNSRLFYFFILWNLRAPFSFLLKRSFSIKYMNLWDQNELKNYSRQKYKKQVNFYNKITSPIDSFKAIKYSDEK